MLCGSYSLMIRSPLWFGGGSNQWWMLRAWYVRRLILRPFEPIDRLTLTSHTPPSLIRRCYQLLQMTDADTNNMHVGIFLSKCASTLPLAHICVSHPWKNQGGSKEEEDAVIFMINSQRELREYVLDLVLDISIHCRPKSIMTTKLFPMSLV